MKKLSVWILVLLCLLQLCPAAMATENVVPEQESADWIIMEYCVNADTIVKDDVVTIEIWLDSAGTVKLSDMKVTPVLSSFNGASLDRRDENYLAFESARYMGTGNTFSFRVGDQLLSLPIHECEEETKQEQGTDQTTPILQVGKKDQSAPIAKGETRTVELWVQNLTDWDLLDVTATVTPSAELMITDPSVTYPIGFLWHGDVAFIPVSVCAFGEIASAAQSLSVEIGYTYDNNGSMVRGTVSQTVPLTAAVSKESETMSASVPNVIISGFDYGGEKISAGTVFDLALEFQNTSSVKAVENLVMTIDPGTALAIAGGTNSYHFPQLAAGGRQKQVISLQALPDAPSAPAVVTASFSYEYVDQEQRKTVSVQQTVSLPVYQLDRFELTQEQPSIQAWQYEEGFLTLSYINKGKGTVYNVSAELQGDIGVMSRVQNVGNVEAGRSGTIDFIITPEMAGEQTCKVVVTYEDDAMQLMSKEFSFDVFVNEAYVPEVFPEEELIVEEPSSGGGWILPVVCGVAAVAVVVLIVVLRARKKKKSGVVDSFVFTDGTEDSHESF